MTRETLAVLKEASSNLTANHSITTHCTHFLGRMGIISLPHFLIGKGDGNHTCTMQFSWVLNEKIQTQPRHSA